LPFYVFIEFYVPFLSVCLIFADFNLLNTQGGIQDNVEPAELNALFEIHLSQIMDHKEFENTIERWCQKTGPAVIHSFRRKDPKFNDTKLDSMNPYWIAFKKTCDENNFKLRIRVRPTSSDSRFLREVSITRLPFVQKFKYAMHRRGNIYYCYFVIIIMKYMLIHV